MSVQVGKTATTAAFPVAAKAALEDRQLRSNVRRATDTIRAKRELRVEEMPDWQALRDAASAIKAHTLANLEHYLVQFEERCTAAGGTVHWARDAAEANAIAIDLIRLYSAGELSPEVIKVKTMTSDEVQMNVALQRAGIEPIETDLADMIVQMGDDEPSHIVVPALHRNRHEVAEIFREKMQRPELSAEPEVLTEAARMYLREKFLYTRIGISGANFAVAETGAVCVVESEGNGRMCVTLPEVLITLIGIEKVIPAVVDLEVFLQLLPRSATGERMNPYNSFWTGVTPWRWAAAVPRHSSRQWPHAAAAGRTRARNTGVHSLRRVFECVPGVSRDRGPCVWLDLLRADRSDFVSSAAKPGAFAFAAVRIHTVRCVL